MLYADGRGAPDLEEADGVEHLLRRAQGPVYGAARQLGLVDDDHALFVPAKAHVVDVGHLPEFFVHGNHSSLQLVSVRVFASL